MKDQLRKQLKDYKKSTKSNLEKEMINIIFRSSETYTELNNFFIHYYENGIDSGIIPELIQKEFCNSFFDKNYDEINNFFKKQHYTEFQVLKNNKDIKMSIVQNIFHLKLNGILS